MSKLATKPRATGATEPQMKRFYVEGHGCPKSVIEAFDQNQAASEYWRVFMISPTKLVTREEDGEVVSVPRSVSELSIQEIG